MKKIVSIVLIAALLSVAVFALTYLIKHQDLFNIEAITIAPYSHHKHFVSVPDGQKLSYKEAKKICDYFGFDSSKV